MIFKISIKSIVRSKGKTLLFLLLIFTLTLALALGVSVWASVDQFLDDCDEFYTTIGLLEYMGTGYPDDTGYDDAMIQALENFDEGIISNDEATVSWEAPKRSFGYIDGFWRTDGYVPGKNLSVLVIGKISFDKNYTSYRGTIFDAPYSVLGEADSLIYIDTNFAEFEPDHYYLVFGEVTHSRSPILRLRIGDFDNAIVDANGIEIPRIIDITEERQNGTSYKMPADSILSQVAETLTVRNNSILLTATDDITSLLPFHQEELYILEGRLFTDDEYVNGSHVAIISELMAARLGVGIGDSVDISVAASEFPGIYNSYWAPDGFTHNSSFTIVGIMNTVMDNSWHVFIPDSTGIPSSQFQIGYTVGHAVIENEEAAAFLSRVEPLLKDRFQLTIYDQGYSSVAIPYQSILRVAKIVTSVCLLVEVAVLILFGFLFVYRQRETSETMLMLGSGRTRVVGYFLFSSGFIALIASIAGVITGYHLHELITEIVIRTANNFTLIDSRYSNGNLTISKTLEFAPKLEWNLFITVGAAVFIFSILSCLAFTISTFIHSRPSEKQAFGPKREHKTSHINGGSMKYAILSILRGSSRSMVVPILAFAVVFFFGQLATTSLRYQNQLEAIYDNTTIDGFYTDINGKQIGNQVLNAYDVTNLFHTGEVSSLSISYGEPYNYQGISKTADGTENEIPPFYVPSNAYRHESAIRDDPTRS